MSRAACVCISVSVSWLPSSTSRSEAREQIMHMYITHIRMCSRTHKAHIDWLTFAFANRQWNSSNTRDLLEYSIRAGYDIYGLELGNELSNAITGQAHADFFRELAALLVELYPDESKRPKVMHAFVITCNRIPVELDDLCCTAHSAHAMHSLRLHSCLAQIHIATLSRRRRGRVAVESTFAILSRIRQTR